MGRSRRMPADCCWGGTDCAIGLAHRSPGCFHDERRQDLIEHEVATFGSSTHVRHRARMRGYQWHDELRPRREDGRVGRLAANRHRPELSQLHRPMCIRSVPATEEMTFSIDEISRQVEVSAQIAGDAMEQARRTQRTCRRTRQGGGADRRRELPKLIVSAAPIARVGVLRSAYG